MFVANLDADRQGIHGYRIMINEDNSLEMIPVWSFSSANAKIIHLATIIYKNTIMKVLKNNNVGYFSTFLHKDAISWCDTDDLWII